MTFGALEEIAVRRAPKFLRGRVASIFLKSGAAVLDEALETLRQGMCLNNPIVSPRELLPDIARERGLPTLPSEPEEATRARLPQWLQLHRARASHLGVMQHVQAYFVGLTTQLPTLRAVHQSGTGVAVWNELSSAGAYSISNVSPSNFDYDGQTSHWARWWLFIYMAGTVLAGPPKYGAGHKYGDGSVYGGLTTQQLSDLVTLALGWKRGGTMCCGVALVWTAGAVDPAGTPTQDADGRWSLPDGANTWASLVDPTTGKATRPSGVQWIYEANG